MALSCQRRPVVVVHKPRLYLLSGVHIYPTLLYFTLLYLLIFLEEAHLLINMWHVRSALFPGLLGS